MAGVARTVVAEDDHLSVLTALAAAGPDDVLVIVTNGGQRAILGELVATEAGAAASPGIVVDGYIRDVQGIRKLDCRCSPVAPIRPPGRSSDGRSPVRPCAAAAWTWRPATSCSATTTAS